MLKPEMSNPEMLGLQHNVINLLYALKGSLETHLARLQESAFGADPGRALKDAHEMMARAHAQIDHVLVMTRRISHAMKMAAPCEGPAESVSIREVWEEVAALLQKNADPSGAMELICHIPEDFPEIFCGRRDLAEILYCVSDNAVQAMKGRGKIIVRASLGFKSDEDPVAAITLADTGPGIAKETLGRLFEPFMTTKPPGQGSGLGLCIVRGLVRKNGGSIAVSSFEGCGTTFTLNFPVAKPAPRRPGAYALR